MALARRCLDCGTRTRASRCPDCTRRRDHTRNHGPIQQARLAITNEQRWRVYRRDGYRCRLCGATDDLTLDHVQPLARTRPKSWVRDNELQTLCRSCNSRKAPLTLPTERTFTKGLTS